MPKPSLTVGPAYIPPCLQVGQRLDDIRATDTADPMLKQLFEVSWIRHKSLKVYEGEP